MSVSRIEQTVIEYATQLAISIEAGIVEQDEILSKESKLPMTYLANPCPCGGALSEISETEKYCEMCNRRYVRTNSHSSWWNQTTALSKLKNPGNPDTPTRASLIDFGKDPD